MTPQPALARLDIRRGQVGPVASSENVITLGYRRAGSTSGASAAVYRAPCRCGESGQAGYRKRGEHLFLAQSGFARVVQIRPWVIALVSICYSLVVDQIKLIIEFSGLREPW